MLLWKSGRSTFRSVACASFMWPPGWGALRLCQHRAEYMVPCSRQSPFPYLCSAPLRCGQWMPILGDPGVHEMGIPSRNGDPQQHIWKALPHTRQEPTPAANGPPHRPALPGFAPALPGSRRVPSHIGDPREHNRTDPPPTASGISTCAAQVYPTLAALPARFQPQWPSPRAQLGSPPPPPPGADTRPAPPGFAPPLPRSRGAAHLHQWLLVSPVPTPGSRRGSRTSLLPPGQT